MDNFKKYLPSKKFIATIISILILIGVFFLIKGAISLLKNRKSFDKRGEPITMTVGTIIQKDGNNNGIADWEEYLWGLDPNKNGAENKEFILAKKKLIEQNEPIENNDDSQTITQNDLLTRQFFATIMALQQNGSLDEEALASISESIGQEVSTAPIPDTYTINMLVQKSDSTEANIAYFKAFNALVDKYKNEDIGSELTIVAQGIVNNDPQALYSVKSIATAYSSFAKDLVKIPTPKSISNTIVSMANNYEKTSKSIDGLTFVISDPIIGMRSILNYKKYSDGLVSDIEKLSEILQ